MEINTPYVLARMAELELTQTKLAIILGCSLATAHKLVQNKYAKLPAYRLRQLALALEVEEDTLLK